MTIMSPSHPRVQTPHGCPATSLQSLRMESRRLRVSAFFAVKHLQKLAGEPIWELYRGFCVICSVKMKLAALSQNIGRQPANGIYVPSWASGAIMRTPFRRALKPLRKLFHAFALSVTDADTGDLTVSFVVGHISNHAGF